MCGSLRTVSETATEIECRETGLKISLSGPGFDDAGGGPGGESSLI